jgi:hypothetical protein
MEASFARTRIAAWCSHLGFQLGKPQGELTVGLQVGDAVPYCSLFGGPDVTKDNGNEFQASDAPANILCRVP